MTRREREVAARELGIKPPEKGHGRYSLINNAARRIGELGLNGQPHPKLQTGLGMEGVIFSRHPSHIRNEGGSEQTKPNRVFARGLGDSF